jgi:hypothetical protein
VIMDKMTESELCSIDEAHSIFDDFEPRPFAHVDISICKYSGLFLINDMG